MSKRKNISILIMMLAAVALLCAATHAEATCTSAELAAATCLDTGGYELRVASTPFPTQNNDGSTTFTYTIAPLPGTSKNVSTLDILVPVCNADYNLDGIVDNLISISTGDPNGWKSYPAGQGSSNTNYGLGVTQYSVLEYNFSVATQGSFYLHTTKAASGTTSVGLKIGSQLFYGAILAPACFVPVVAGTTSEVVQLDPLHPERFITVLKNADGTLINVLDSSGNPLPIFKLADSPIWACLSPNLDSSGNYIDCNISLLPLTYAPDGAVLRWGKHTCYSKNITSGGVTYSVSLGCW